MSWRTLAAGSLLALTLTGVPDDVLADVYADATAGRHVVTPAFFGMHFHRLRLKPGEREIPTAWPEIQIGGIRVWDAATSWQDVAPRPGVWTFDMLDYVVDAAIQHQSNVLYTFGITPRWASARPDEKCPYGTGCGAEPVRLAHWDEYVRRVAERYHGRVEAYELWNEPKFTDFERDRLYQDGFYTGDVATMVEMARRARAVLDTAAPEALLFTPGFVNGPERLDLFLAKGGSKYVQGIAYHFYDFNTADCNWFAQSVVAVRAVMKRHHLENLPLWNTETGVETDASDARPDGIPRGHKEATAPAKVAQLLILGAFAGIERFYYYAWDSERSGMVTRNGGTKRPRYEALRRMQDWLPGVQTRGCTSADGELVRCEAERGEERYLYLWGSQDKTRSVALPAGWTVKSVDLLDGSAVPAVAGATGMISLSIGRAPVRIRMALH